MRQKSYKSFEDFRRGYNTDQLERGLALSREGKYEDAVGCLDSIKRLDNLPQEETSLIKNAYVQYAKIALSGDKKAECLRYYQKACEFDRGDYHINERLSLLQTSYDYRCESNIIQFRRTFSLGCTDGGLTGHRYPFQECGHFLIEDDVTPVYSSNIDGYSCLGRYLVQFCGKHLLSEAIRKFKRFGHEELAKPLAWLTADYIRKNTGMLKEIDILIPSPSNPNKQSSRGFAPCFEMAKELSRCLFLPKRELFLVPPMDVRFRQLPYDVAKAMVRYDPHKLKNIVAGRVMLFLDDVATSGRTINIFAEILKEQGAAKVYAFTLAHTGG